MSFCVITTMCPEFGPILRLNEGERWVLSHQLDHSDVKTKVCATVGTSDSQELFFWLFNEADSNKADGARGVG